MQGDLHEIGKTSTSEKSFSQFHRVSDEFATMLAVCTIIINTFSMKTQTHPNAAEAMHVCTL